MAYVYGLVGFLILLRSVFTRYRLIQFSMMQEMTSFTFLYAFSTPEIAPTTEPATIEASKQGNHPQPRPTAQ